MATPELENALDSLAFIFGDSMTADQVGGHFTCFEAEVIADVLKASGHDEQASTWLKGHAACHCPPGSETTCSVTERHTCTTSPVSPNTQGEPA